MNNGPTNQQTAPGENNTKDFGELDPTTGQFGVLDPTTGQFENYNNNVPPTSTPITPIPGSLNNPYLPANGNNAQFGANTPNTPNLPLPPFLAQNAPPNTPILGQTAPVNNSMAQGPIHTYFSNNPSLGQRMDQLRKSLAASSNTCYKLPKIKATSETKRC